MSVDLLDNVRRQCREVARRAAFVRIDAAALSDYAASLPLAEMVLPKMDPAIHYLGHDRDTVAYFLILNAVNFGSGYFPAIFRDTARSGYRTVAAGLTRNFTEHGCPAAEDLCLLDAVACAVVFGFDPADPLSLELMGLFARALNDLGGFLRDYCGGDYVSLVEQADRSAEQLATFLRRMPLFDDTAVYGNRTVSFYKRAQLAAVDLFIAFAGKGPGNFADLDRITICADNLVPHVLRLDGVLHYDEGLVARIEQGETLPAGSPEEVEIRACAVHAGEMIVARLQERGVQVNALMLDNFLWHRGQEAQYRGCPRHRTLTTSY